MQDYTLDIVCPHCSSITRITQWPRSRQDPVLFTCTTEHGGCGGQAYLDRQGICILRLA